MYRGGSGAIRSELVSELSWGACLLGVLIFVAPPLLAAETPDGSDAARGQQVFAQNCATCHGNEGSGGFGPKLAPISARKDHRPVTDIIKEPSANMPPLFPASLSERDVEDVATYLQTLK